MNIEETYREYIRCVHCGGFVGSSDALDAVCDPCLEKEKFDFSCNDCDHEWTGVGLQLRCPSCNSTGILSIGSSRVEKVRQKKLQKYLLGTSSSL